MNQVQRAVFLTLFAAATLGDARWSTAQPFPETATALDQRLRLEGREASATS